MSRVPVLLGGGIPLSGALGTDVLREPVATTALSDGFAQARYRTQTDTASPVSAAR